MGFKTTEIILGFFGSKISNPPSPQDTERLGRLKMGGVKANRALNAAILDMVLEAQLLQSMGVLVGVFELFCDVLIVFYAILSPGGVWFVLAVWSVSKLLDI